MQKKLVSLILGMLLFAPAFVAAETFVEGQKHDDVEILDFNGADAPSVSSANDGRIYFDATAGVFKVSENGGAYANLVGGGGDVVSDTTPQLGGDLDTNGKDILDASGPVEIADSLSVFNDLTITSGVFYLTKASPVANEVIFNLATDADASRVSIDEDGDYVADGSITINSGTLTMASGGLTINSSGLYNYGAGGTTSTIFGINPNSLTSGTAISGSSSSNSMTGRIFKAAYSGTGSGNVAELASTNSSASGTLLDIDNRGTGYSLYVKDVSSDTSPIVMDANGNMGIGTQNPLSKLGVIGDVSISNNLSANYYYIGTGTVLRDNGGGDAEFSEDHGATWTDFGSGGSSEWTDDGNFLYEADFRKIMTDLNGALSLDGNLTMSTGHTFTLDVGGTETDVGALLASHDSQFYFELTTGSVIQWTGSAIITNDLTVQGVLFITSLGVSSMQIANDLEVGDDANILGTLTVSDDVWLASDLSVKGYFKTSTYPTYESTVYQQGLATNLSMSVHSNTTVNVTADRLWVQGYLIQGMDETFTITTGAGNAGGYDDTEAARQWIELWAIYNPTTQDVALYGNNYLTTSGSTSVTKPSGYTHGQFIGFVRNDVSSNLDIISNSVTGHGTYSAVTIPTIGSGGTDFIRDGNPYDYDASYYVPPDARMWYFNARCLDTASTGSDFNFYPKAQTSTCGQCATQTANVRSTINVAYPLFGGNARKMRYDAESNFGAGDDTSIKPYAWDAGGGSIEDAVIDKTW